MSYYYELNQVVRRITIKNIYDYDNNRILYVKRQINVIDDDRSPQSRV